MINTPLNRDEVKEITVDNPHYTKYQNRKSRRERISKRNMVIQVIGDKQVLHKKPTNLPREYRRMSKIKSIKEAA